MRRALGTAAPPRAGLVRMFLRATLGAGLVVGCAQLFGIDEACVVGEAGCAESVNPGGGASGAAGAAPCAPGSPGCEFDAGVEGLCAQYCTQIGDRCSNTPQYDDARPEECPSLCRYFPRATGGSATGNTLECRLNRVLSASGERSDCLAAGRGGDGVCGTNCEAYCSLMQALCPMYYSEFDPSDSPSDDAAECAAQCARLSDRGNYDPATLGEDEFDEPGEATVQCRLWHLGSAALEVEQFGTFDNSHCGHAVGVRDCNPTPPP